MRVKQLRELLKTLPVEYDNHRVYITIRVENEEHYYGPELFHDVDEFVIDVEDTGIVLRSVID